MALGRLADLDPRPEAMRERLRWYQAAVAAHPRNVAARNNLGAALLDRGDLNAAMTCFRDAIRIDPRKMTRNALAHLLQLMGKLEEVIALHRRTIEIGLGDAETRNALAWFHATGPDGVRDGERAVEHATKRAN